MPRVLPKLTDSQPRRVRDSSRLNEWPHRTKINIFQLRVVRDGTSAPFSFEKRDFRARETQRGWYALVTQGPAPSVTDLNVCPPEL